MKQDLSLENDEIEGLKKLTGSLWRETALDMIINLSERIGAGGKSNEDRLRRIVLRAALITELRSIDHV